MVGWVVVMAGAAFEKGREEVGPNTHSLERTRARP